MGFARSLSSLWVQRSPEPGWDASGRRGQGQGLSPHHVSICAGSTPILKLLFVAPHVPLLMETLWGLSGGCRLLHQLPSAGGLISPGYTSSSKQRMGSSGFTRCAAAPRLRGCKAVCKDPGPIP